MNSLDISAFQDAVISWHANNGRRFPWREGKLTPWKWLLLESLLRQTRASQVELVFDHLVAKYDSPTAVLQAPRAELIADLRPLGLFNQRVTALLSLATAIEERGGRVPDDDIELKALPHVGGYIAGAVLCFGFGMRRPVVDVNVARILARVQGEPPPSDARRKWVWELATSMLPDKDYTQYNYGLLDIGALHCHRTNPHCQDCGARPFCASTRRVTFMPCVVFN